jgi:DUF4097 and DUF4098 domain-containing protein YvlB
MKKNIHRSVKGAPGRLVCLLLAATTMPLSLAGQDRVDERRPLASDGRLDVQVVAHEVRIEAWDQDEVHVTGTLDSSAQRFEISGSDRSLNVRIEHQRGEWNRSSGTLELRVPRGARVSVTTMSGDLSFEGVAGTVRAQVVSGAIRLRGAPSSADLQAVSGPIEVTGPVDDLQVQAVSGDIRVRGAVSRVSASAVSGHVRIDVEGVAERIRANNVSGGVEVSARLAPRATVDLESHSGTLILRVPVDTAADFDLESFSGSIRNQLTGDEPRSVRWSNTLGFRIGDATARVRMSTFSGSLVLEPLR